MLKMCKNTLKSMNELDHRILVPLEQPCLRSLMWKQSPWNAIVKKGEMCIKLSFFRHFPAFTSVFIRWGLSSFQIILKGLYQQVAWSTKMFVQRSHFFQQCYFVWCIKRVLIGEFRISLYQIWCNFSMKDNKWNFYFRTVIPIKVNLND